MRVACCQIAPGVETLVATCDLAGAREKRTGVHNDAFADRRPGCYARVLAHDSGALAHD